MASFLYILADPKRSGNEEPIQSIMQENKKEATIEHSSPFSSLPVGLRCTYHPTKRWFCTLGRTALAHREQNTPLPGNKILQLLCSCKLRQTKYDTYSCGRK